MRKYCIKSIYVKYSPICAQIKSENQREFDEARGTKVDDRRFKIYLFNAKLDATTLVQKHKIVALKGNDTLRAGPRVSPQTRRMMLRAFSSLLFFPIIRQYIAIPLLFYLCRDQKKKERKGNASSLTGDDEKGTSSKNRVRRRTKRTAKCFQRIYQSSIHKRATRFAASLKK